MEYLLRAKAVKARVDRLGAEARAASAARDVARVEAIAAEMSVCLDSLHEIREEQLAEQLRASRPARRRFFGRRRESA
jgi:hypothetical protein